jgi:excinuclease UvrABC ATPase subunit
MGGQVIAVGTPEKIITNTKSYTARYLKEKLAAEQR